MPRAWLRPLLDAQAGSGGTAIGLQIVFDGLGTLCTQFFIVALVATRIGKAHYPHLAGTVALTDRTSNLFQRLGGSWLDIGLIGIKKHLFVNAVNIVVCITAYARARQRNFFKFHIGQFGLGHVPSVVHIISGSGSSSGGSFAIAVNRSRISSGLSGLVFGLRFFLGCRNW